MVPVVSIECIIAGTLSNRFWLADIRIPGLPSIGRGSSWCNGRGEGCSSEFTQLAVQRVAADPQLAGGCRDVAAGRFQRAPGGVAADCLEAAGRARRYRRGGLEQLFRQVAFVDQ